MGIWKYSSERNMRYSIPGISVRKTAVGRGVFATKQFRKNQVIGQMKGSVKEAEECDPEYAVDFGDVGLLEPWAPFRYLNHCCKPNAELVMYEPAEDDDDPEPPSMWVEALRTIRPGEQVVIDYAWTADDAIRCLCGAKDCRGWVVAEEELATVLRRHGEEPQPESVRRRKRQLGTRSPGREATGRQDTLAATVASLGSAVVARR